MMMCSSLSTVTSVPGRRIALHSVQETACLATELTDARAARSRERPDRGGNDRPAQSARDVFTRRQEGVSIWAVRAEHIHASDPQAKPEMFDPAEDKIYRHPTFYKLPKEVDNM